MTARHYTLLALGAVAFTMYGSFVPFEFVARPWADVVDGFWRVAEGGVGIGSRSDFLANCLLGGPLGFCLLGAWQVDRGGRGFAAGVVVWLACVAVAIVVEFFQAYFPARTAALSDVMAQAIGAAVGVAAWWVGGQRFTDWVRDTRVGTAGRFLAAYLVLVVAVQLLPLDLTISPAVVYRKLRDGHATLTPFGEWFRADGEVAPNRWGKVQTWIELAGLYLPVGMLARYWRSNWGGGRIAGAGLAFAAATEVGQFLVSRHPSVTDVIVGACGVLVGWMVSREATAERAALPPTEEPLPQPMTRFGRFGGGTVLSSPPAPPSSAVASRLNGSLELALLLGQAWFVVLAVTHWQPFDFGGGSQRGAAITWFPFADLATRNYLGALDQAIGRMILFVPLGVLVAARKGSGRLAAMVGLGTALVLEIGQVFLPERFPSTTDLITAAFGAWLGAKVTQRVMAR